MTWRSLGAVAAACALMGMPASPASALFSSQVTIRGGVFPDQTVGGNGVPSVQVADSGTYTDPGGLYVRFQSADVTSAAATGVQLLDLLTTVDVSSETGPKGTGDIEGIAELQDAFTIGAGSSGLADGTPVQILLQARFTGEMQLEGSPGGRGRISYFVDVGSAGNELEWTTGRFYPPAEVSIDESDQLLVDTTVGATVILQAGLSSHLQSTAVDPGSSGTNTANAMAIVRISHAPGYETIEIVSEAGAPIGPLLNIPLLHPWMPAAFAAVLLLAGFWSLRRIRAAG